MSLMNKHESSEVVVIGGGAVGTSVASFLARAGHEVVLIEKGEYAWGTSRRCDGHVCTYDSPPGYFSRLCKIGLDMFHDIVNVLDYDIEFEPEGLGLLVDNENDMEVLLQTAEGKRQEGISCTFWDRSELARNEPNVSERVIACLNFDGDAKINPMRLVFGLAQNAAKNRARLLTRTSVTGITVHGGKVCSVETDRGSIKAEKVIFAAGVWTKALGDMVGVHIPIQPRQGMILVTERLSGMMGKNYVEFGYLAAKGNKKRPNVTPSMEEYGIAAVFEPTAEGTILLGSSRRFVGFDWEPKPEVIQAIAQRSIYFFPRLAEAKIIRAYAGLRPCSPDGKPVISPTHIEGVYVTSGHEGNGIGLSLVTGKLITQILAGEEPVIDVAPLSIDRFGLNPPALPAG